MIKLGFDAKRLFHNFTGLGNYSRTIVQNLQTFYPEHQYHLFSPSIKPSKRTSLFLNYQKFTTHTGRGNAAYWRTFGIKQDLIANGIQLYHGLSHEIPKGIRKTGIKSVVTIHDLVFKHYPHLFPIIDRKIYDWKFRYSCENADRIIAISENTKKDIIRFYKIPPQKIEVIYQTCADAFKEPVPANQISAVLKKYQLPEDYLLYVGSIIERKNLLQVVKALHLIPAGQRPALVVIGDGKAYEKTVKQFVEMKGLNTYVHFLKNHSFTDFPAIYTQAKALVYPSVYEGFGIPLIEALFCKTPVITTQVSSLPEAAGPGAFYLKKPEPEQIKAGIEKISDDPEYAKNLAEKGHQYVQRFQSKALTTQLMDLYKKVLGIERK